MVAQVCGCTPEALRRVAELLCANSGRERTSAIVYAVGWTQHTTGVQTIRAAGILQMLLGNIGRPGGGIMAMRGHASIQGSTDVPTLYDLLPGYLPQPIADPAHETLDGYVAHEGFPTGYWANVRSFIVSLLKAWYGDAATAANDFCFPWLTRIDDNYSQLPTFDRMGRGAMKGYVLFGQNPAAGGPNARLHRAGLRNLDWLVVLDWFETESAVFWKSAPGGPGRNARSSSGGTSRRTAGSGSTIQTSSRTSRPGYRRPVPPGRATAAPPPASTRTRRSASAAALLRPALELLLLLNLVGLGLLLVDVRAALPLAYTPRALVRLGALVPGGGFLVPLCLLIVGSPLLMLGGVLLIVLGALRIRFEIVTLPHVLARVSEARGMLAAATEEVLAGPR